MTDSLVTVWDTDSPQGVEAFPADTQAFLDYDDGNPIGGVIRERFPNAVGITITTVPGAFNLEARCCDTEASGFTPDQAAYWAYEKIRQGRGRPCIYVEVSEKPAVAEALVPYGLEFGRDIDAFIAWWNGVADVPQGIVESPHGPVGTGVGNVGHQYLNNGDLYDISVALAAWVYGPWPPEPPEETDMYDAIEIVPTPTYPKGGTFVDGGTAWIGPVDDHTITELKANNARIFKSTTNSLFNAKPAVAYPNNHPATKQS